MRESTMTAAFWDRPLLAAPHRAYSGVAFLAVAFLAIAVWNGFPLVFYDTGAYMAEGLQGAFLVERSPVYSIFLLFTGGWWSFWLVVVAQSLMTAFIITEVARAEVPGLTLAGLVTVALALMAVTGIGWYVGQVEPDCFTPLVVLGSYLLLFRDQTRARRNLTVFITGLAVACHPSHLGLIGGLLLMAGLLSLAARRFALPRPRLLRGLAALGLSLALTMAANYALARSVFISRSGSVFVFARLMQDGIVKRLLDDTCPASGYKLCAYRGRLSKTANEWLWGPNSAFHDQGGFQKSQEEDARIIADSLRRYPMLHIEAAVYDSVLQFFTFKTGDGIESQEWILVPGFKRMAPGQLQAYLGARQQHNQLRFKTLNLLHVPVGVLSVLGVLLFLNRSRMERRWNEALLPGVVVLGLVGNAIICGTFSNPHDRYQSRLIWTPALVLLLAWARDPRALQPAPESGT